MHAQEFFRALVVPMYLGDHDRFHHVFKGCLQWQISHSSIFTIHDATDENIPKYCSSGCYSKIGTYFLCRLLYLQCFKNILHQYFTTLSGIRRKISTSVLKIFLRQELLLSLETSFHSIRTLVLSSVNLFEDPSAIFLQIEINFPLFLILVQA